LSLQLASSRWTESKEPTVIQLLDVKPLGMQQLEVSTDRPLAAFPAAA